MTELAFISLKTMDGKPCGFARLSGGFAEIRLLEPLAGQAAVLTDGGVFAGNAGSRIAFSGRVQAVALHRDGRLLCMGLSRGAAITPDRIRAQLMPELMPAPCHWQREPQASAASAARTAARPQQAVEAAEASTSTAARGSARSEGRETAEAPAAASPRRNPQQTVEKAEAPAAAPLHNNPPQVAEREEAPITAPLRNNPPQVAEREEAQTAARREAHTDTEARADAAAHTDTELRVDAAAQTDANTRADAVAHTDAELRADAVAHTDTELRVDAAAQTDAELRVDAVAQTDAKARADAAAHTDTELRVDAAAQADAEVRVDTAAQADAELRADVVAQTDAELRADAAVQTDAKARADAAAQADAEVRVDTAAQADAKEAPAPAKTDLPERGKRGLPIGKPTAADGRSAAAMEQTAADTESFMALLRRADRAFSAVMHREPPPMPAATQTGGMRRGARYAPDGAHRAAPDVRQNAQATGSPERADAARANGLDGSARETILQNAQTPRSPERADADRATGFDGSAREMFLQNAQTAGSPERADAADRAAFDAKRTPVQGTPLLNGRRLYAEANDAAGDWYDEVERLLENGPPSSRSEPVANPFPNIFPGAKFLSIRKPGVPAYLSGDWHSGRGPAAERTRITAVPGAYSPRPPAHLTGFTRYIRTRTGGYWIRVEAWNEPQKGD